MRLSTKLARLCAVVPAALAGGFIAAMSLSFLPSVGLLAAFAVSLVLAAGRWESAGARIFGFARGLRANESAALAPTLALLEVLDLAPARVLLRRTDAGGLPATPIGRRTVIVKPNLIQGLYEQRLTREDAAAVIGHAVASQRVSPARFDLAARLWACPWTMVYAVARQVARAFSWVPAAGFVWRLRAVIGVIVVVQGYQPGGNPTLGIATGALIAISYLAPAADRAWRAVVERDADRIVALAGLAGSLVHYARWQLGPGSAERVRRISAAAAERQRVRAQDEHPTCRTARGALLPAPPTRLSLAARAPDDR